MITVKVDDKMPNEILEIVKDLRQNGYIQNFDFDLEYHAPKDDYFSGQIVYNRHTIFTFYKEELATWFSLMYQ